MKKLFLFLLIVSLSFFVFTGCQGLVPAEGEEEEEVVTEGVTVDIEGASKVENKTYVSKGSHEITVTFPEPVDGWVKGNITPCTGDYRVAIIPEDSEVVFYPNQDRTVWTGSGTFADNYLLSNDKKKPYLSLCCASYLQITSGECEDEVCINMPVIVDSEDPYATIELCMDDCTCGGCELSFSSTVTSSVCEDDTANCGDDCSGLAGWSITLYDKYPFDDCCDTPCEEPVDTMSGSSCPIQWTTECLTEESYYVIVTLTDHAENEVTFGRLVEFDVENCDTIRLSNLDPSECLDAPTKSGLVVCEGQTMAIGDKYQGGVIAYILQSGDPGYVSGETHGLIAATEDQSTGIQWYNGSYISTGATATEIGTGLANTNTIISEQEEPATNYAAGLARAHSGGGYSDWFLPSKDELNLMYENLKVAGVGGFADCGYWSSSEVDANHAWSQNFYNAVQYYNDDKNYTHRVRAVRAF